jgi:lipoprotein-releasing system permease protein
MPFELFIAVRYLLARRRQAFVSVISLISTLGVMVGVMALIIALAVTTGVQNEMRDRLLGSTAHVYVWKDGSIDDYRAEVKQLAAIDGVLGVGPAIVTVKAMLQSPANTTFINIKGIDPELEPQVTDIETSMQQGSVAGRPSTSLRS